MSLLEKVDDRDDRFYQLVADYLEAAETGTTPDQTTILAGRTDLAPELAEFVASLNQVERHMAPLRHVMGVNPAEAVPPSFGDFELLNEIGRGGMGVVYRARQVSLNRIVALKMIRSSVLDRNANARRFRSEAEAAARLDHPGIVPIYEIGEHDRHPYFSMKFLEGGSLAEHIAQYTNNPRRGAELMASIARAVHHAHERGILHRDLKPSNILIDGEGRPHVADFGLAKWLDGGQEFTQTGTIIGTPAYMAPELAMPSSPTSRREAVTTASDIYGLGAVLYAALVGKPPFQGTTPIETLAAVCQREPPDPGNLNRLVDRDLATICLKCLQKEPRQRYSSAAAVAEDLDRWLAGQPILARPIGNWERSRRWCDRNRLLSAIAGSAALLLVVSIVALASGYLLVSQARQTADEHRRDAEQTADSLRERVYVAQMERGIRHWEMGEYDELRRVLDEFGPYAALEGFEYRWLDAECRSSPRELVRYTGHQGILYSAAFSPDGTTVASCGEDRSIQIWNAATGARQSVLRPRPETATLPVEGHTEDENRVCFSPDGRWLASGSEDGSVRLWDLATGDWRALTLSPGFEVLSIEFSRDGRWIISAGADTVVRVWDPVRAALAGEFREHRHPVTCAVVSHDSRTVISVDRAGEIRGWDLETRALKFGMSAGMSLFCVAIAPDGKWLATGGVGGDVRTWKIPEGVPMGTPIHDIGPIQSLDVSPDGTRLAICGDDACVRVRMTGNGEILHNFRAHDTRMWSVRFSPDGQRLLTASADRTAKIWQIPPSHRLRRWDIAESSPIRRLAFAPKGALLAFVSDEGHIVLGDVETRGALRKVPVAAAKGTMPVFSPDGKELALVGQNGDVRRWSLSESRELTAYSSAPSDRASAHWNPSLVRLAYTLDNRLAALRSDGQLSIGDGERWQVYALPRQVPVPYQLLTPLDDGRSLAIYDAPHFRIIHWDLDRRSIAAELPLTEFPVTVGACSPNRQFAALGGVYGNIRLIDLRNGAEQARMIGHRAHVADLAFSPDGKTLASTGTDGTVRLWNLSTRQELFVLEADRTRPHHAVAFSADGRFLVVASPSPGGGNTVSVYDAGPPAASSSE